jgi:DNA-damage-inducible protein J
MFLTQIVLNDGLPFDMRVPNAQTRKAIEELENPVKRAKLKRYGERADAHAPLAKGSLKWTANSPPAPTAPAR